MKTLILILLMATGAGAATVTSYCHCAKCNGTASQPTASGVMPREGVTVAGPRNIPFGTRVHIQGVGWRVVQDRLAYRFEGRYDIFVRSHRRAQKFGVKELAVTLKRL